MLSKPRLSVRKLMIWIGVIAVLLALGRYPYTFLRTQARFSARCREGDAFVRTYYTQCPTGTGAASWDEAVTCVQIAWGNVVFSPFHFPNENSLDQIVAQMRCLVARANPADAEGDLYLILDLLAHARTRASPAYMSARREAVKRVLHGYGRPSPVLVDYALRWLGPGAGESIHAAIAEGLRAKDWRLRVACCRALGQFGLGLGTQDDANAALTELIRALDDDDPLVREIAIESFHEMGLRAARARDTLIEKLRLDPSDRVRWQAARSLTQVDREAKVVVPALITAMGDDDRHVRIMAISSLGELRETASDAMSAVCKALHDESYEVRRTAVEVLPKIGRPSDPVVLFLLDVLKSDPEWQVRDVAASALGEIGPKAATAGAPLIDAVRRDHDAPVRSASAQALVLVGPADSSLAAILARVLKQDEAEHVRVAAAEALGRIGSPADCAVQQLIDATNDPEDAVRTAAAEALGKIGPEARRSVRALVRLLLSTDTRTQRAAIQSLGALGAAARPAIAAIRALRDASPKDVNEDIRAAASAALAKIGSEP